LNLLDVNIVLAAHRADHPRHEPARHWFDELLRSRRPFTVPDVVWVGFVRIATNRRIFTVPTPVDDAFAFVRAVRAQPGYAAVAPGASHRTLFEDACRDADAAGDLAVDAYLAALALEHDCTLVSFDRDFARFPGLRWANPGDGS
jgi:toxin-antitoxin system PIN domain toxin